MSSIIFDFDGTLLDSRERHIRVLHDCILKWGFDFASDDLKDYISYKSDGHSTRQFLISRLGLNIKNAEIIAQDWVVQIENEQYLCFDRLYNDSIPALQMCNAMGYSINLLTARQFEGRLNSQIINLGISRFFAKVICVSPENAITMKNNYMRESSDCMLVVGDTEVDYKAAVMNNIPYYILNRGFRSMHYWDNIHVKHHNDLSLLSNYIK